jgi:predicted nucleic acid-binding protein
MIFIDTNVIINYFKAEARAVNFFEKYKNKDTFGISIITKIELTSYPNITEEELLKIEEFLKEFIIIPVDENIASICSYIRRKYKTKLGDSIIAATAIYYNSPLLTFNIFNIRDFKKIKELKLISL